MLNLNKNHHRHPEFISGSTRHCERSEESNRHCEQSEAISSRLPRPYGLAMTNETGRSMVEMLGVLAVIGVLSITGISGYTTAMNKHKANEILDAASKRAVAVSTQIQRGNTSPTLGEFGDDDDNTVQNVKFGTPSTVGEKQFKIPLDWTAISDNNQKETLCQYMKQYISEDGENASAQIDEDCTRIVYNNDLSAGTSSSNNTNYDSSTQKCKTGYYGADCASKCSYTHQVANDDNDGCKCATGYTGDTCSTCDSDNNFILKGSSCVQCPTGSTIRNGTSTEAVPDYDGCYCASGYAWDTSANDGDGGCVSAGPVCTNGEKKCSTTSSYQTCINGQWSDATDCPTATPSCLYKGECRRESCYYNNGGTCMCSTNDHCAADKPFCFETQSICVDTMVGSNCSGATDCGVDAHYCNANGKCQAEIPNEDGSYCNGNSDCGTDYPYCVYVNEAFRCKSTAMGASCYNENYCTGDAPYCANGGGNLGSCTNKQGIEEIYCDTLQPIQYLCCGYDDCSSYKAYCDTTTGYCKTRS